MESSTRQTQQDFVCIVGPRLPCLVSKELPGCWAVKAGTCRASEAEVDMLCIRTDAVYDQLLPLFAH